MVFLVSSMGRKRSKVRCLTGKYYTRKKRICEERGLEREKQIRPPHGDRYVMQVSSSGLHDDTILVLVGFVRWT